MITLDFAQKQRIGFQYVLDLCSPASPYGREALRKLRPFSPREADTLQEELDNIECIRHVLQNNTDSVMRLEECFSQLRDIRASLSRIGADLDEVEFFEIKQYLLQLETIRPIFAEITKQCKGIVLQETLPALDFLDLEGNRIASFAVSEHYSPRLAEIRAAKRELERDLRGAEGESRETLLIARAELANRERAEEAIVLGQLSAGLLPWREALLQNTQAIARLDLLLQKAKLALQYNCAKPSIGGEILRFSGMVHPQIAKTIAERGVAFTALDISLGIGATAISGANMGGKSVALKSLALNVLLIHCGFYPFAAEAQCPLFDALYLLSEDLESTERGLSSFGGEMVRLCEILEHKGFALLLLDEPARGTNPTEGAAIVRGICAYLNQCRDISVLASHYEGASSNAAAHYQVAGLQGVDMDALSAALVNLPRKERPPYIARYMDYGIAPVPKGQATPAAALNICRLLGMDDALLNCILVELKE